MQRSLKWTSWLIVMIFAIGCASDEHQETDELWRGGYGFNNPNPERQKNGLPPVDFNGREHKPGLFSN